DNVSEQAYESFIKKRGIAQAVRNCVFLEVPVFQLPNEKELKQWHKASGLPLKRFFNTSGMLYKERKLKERLPEMSEEEMYRLLAADGMLVKRPILITRKGVTTGFKEADWEKLI
ncbi:MAG: arsenate reductase family protein, partial [Proteobacteria bacterium]|nr:arsenate reductase family protein [Pseudomonadota bacterium]